MNSVYKYKVDGLTGTALLEMPANASIIKFDVQFGDVVFWAFVDKDQVSHRARKVCVIGTGDDLPESPAYKHIGTVLLHGGTLVLHAFELLDC